MFHLVDRSDSQSMQFISAALTIQMTDHHQLGEWWGVAGRRGFPVGGEQFLDLRDFRGRQASQDIGKILLRV